jgi:hypothetical protein
LLDYSSSDSDNEEDKNETKIDFFGLNNSKKIRLEDESYLNEPKIFFEEVAPGPSKLLLNNIFLINKFLN